MPRRGSRQHRGYGADHTALRARLAPTVALGATTCWRCGTLIQAWQDWDLGHDDDTGLYRGPEHQHCNRRAGAIKGNKMRGQQRAYLKLKPLKPPPLNPYTDPEW